MARSPRLAVLGTAPSGLQIGVAAERLHWKPADPASADLVYVAGGGDEDLTALARDGRNLALDLDVVTTLGPERVAALFALAAEAGGSLRRGEPLASAPAVRQWLGTVRRMDEVTHLSGVSRSDALDRPLILVALYAARLTGWGAAPVPSLDTERGRRLLRLDFTASGRRRQVQLDVSARDDDVPEWEFQAASPARVARVALLPSPRIEINGEESPVPADHPAVAFGQDAFLRLWWEAVRSGVPARHDPVFVTALCSAVGLLSG